MLFVKSYNKAEDDVVLFDTSDSSQKSMTSSQVFNLVSSGTKVSGVCKSKITPYFEGLRAKCRFLGTDFCTLLGAEVFGRDLEITDFREYDWLKPLALDYVQYNDVVGMVVGIDYLNMDGKPFQTLSVSWSWYDYAAKGDENSPVEIYSDSGSNMMIDYNSVFFKYGVFLTSTVNIFGMVFAFSGIEVIDLDMGLFPNTNVMSRTFNTNNKVRSVTLDFSKFHGKIFRMESVFEQCGQLHDIKFIDIDTSHVESFEHMFYGCNHIKELDLSGFSSESLTDVCEMFSGCLELQEVKLPKWDVSKMLSFAGMFEVCGKLRSVNTSEWVANYTGSNFVISCARMFIGCRSLQELDLSFLKGFIKVDCDSMLCKCTSLKKVKFIGGSIKGKDMFKGCTSLTSVDLSEMVLYGDCSGMFSGCTSLTEIRFGVISSVAWNFSDSIKEVFRDCKKLRHIYIEDESKLDVFKENHCLPFRCKIN